MALTLRTLWRGTLMGLLAGILVLGAVPGVLGAPAATTSSVSVEPAFRTVVKRCQRDLAKRLDVAVADLKVAQVKANVFPDASLGLIRPGEMVAQVQTPGATVLLDWRGWQYMYTVTSRSFRYGGPLESWKYSGLYVQPVENEPNLNGNLMQIALVGACPELLLEGVTEFFPQAGGAILATRRTSRSGFELVYLAPGQRGEGQRLGGGFYIGKAVLSPDGKQWAAIYRWMVGAGWGLLRGKLDGKPEDAVGVPLPDGADWKQLFWTGDNPVIVVKDGDKSLWQQLVGEGEEATWEALDSYDPPMPPSLLFSKSTHLEVSEVEVDGVPAVKLSEVWWTGDRETVIRQIPNLKLRDFQVTEDLGYALINGETPDGEGRTYTVAMCGGELLETLMEGGGHMVLVEMPPLKWLQIGAVQQSPE